MGPINKLCKKISYYGSYWGILTFLSCWWGDKIALKTMWKNSNILDALRELDKTNFSIFIC